MKVYPSKEFQKSFKKLPKEIQLIAIKRDKIFRTNPYSPQLKTHKLKGKLSNLWSYSIKYSYRIVLEFIDEETVIYQDIGTHKIYK
jgi:mRNA-degrading endonuclease YafQ of YafQ-DinJ toxin-antitoxin module